MKKNSLLLAFFHGCDHEESLDILEFSRSYNGRLFFKSSNSEVWVYLTDELEGEVEKEWEKCLKTATLSCESQSKNWISNINDQILHSVEEIKKESIFLNHQIAKLSEKNL